MDKIATAFGVNEVLARSDLSNGWLDVISLCRRRNGDCCSTYDGR